AADLAARLEHCSGARPRAPRAASLYAPAVAATQLGGLLARTPLEPRTSPRHAVTPSPSSSGFAALKPGGAA
ncbi:MAG: hypothetical protein AAGF23_10445, partial [Acidobacteriota bacterium]